MGRHGRFASGAGRDFRVEQGEGSSRRRLGLGCILLFGTTMAKLYFYYSAMNAGKTTTLLQSAHNYHERGMRTLIFTPKLDNRYGDGMVASRIGLKAEGKVFMREDDLLRMARDDIAANGPLHCVLVDEAQFLAKAQVWQL